jgi:hypothetical protein
MPKKNQDENRRRNIIDNNNNTTIDILGDGTIDKLGIKLKKKRI